MPIQERLADIQRKQMAKVSDLNFFLSVFTLNLSAFNTQKKKKANWQKGFKKHEQTIIFK